jgi:hypothetical protein
MQSIAITGLTVVRNLLLVAACITLQTQVVSGKTLYVGQNTAGADTGAGCANAHSAAWFNTPGNWGVGAAQIAPGDTVHLCGTFAGSGGQTMLTTQANGSNGAPITIFLEPGVLFTAPYWGNSFNSGAINVPNNYITVDGGTNGTIQNTLNGTPGASCLGGGCSYQQGTIGIFASGANVIIQNLILTHLYVHQEDVNDAAGDNSAGIQVCSNGTLVSHNTIDNVYSGVVLGCTNVSGIEYAFNTVSFCNHCLKIGINSGTVTGVKIHDNDISNTYVWDEPDNHYHHNGIFTFADPAGTISGQYYNNNFHGIFSRDTAYNGSHTTALIFLEYDNANSYVFNNVFALSSGDLFGTANGYITAGGSSGPQYIYNNTFIDPNSKSECIRGGNNSLDVRNNIFSGCWIALDWSGTIPSFTAAQNIYFNINSGWIWKTDAFVSYSTWRSDCSCDANSMNGVNPNISASTLQPVAGSPSVGFGANLTSIGIAALSADKAGSPRPATGGWTVGAYGGASGVSLPVPPAFVSATVH